MIFSIDITAEPVDQDDQLITFSVLGNIIGRDLVANATYFDRDLMLKHLTKIFDKGIQHAE